MRDTFELDQPYKQTKQNVSSKEDFKKMSKIKPVWLLECLDN